MTKYEVRNLFSDSLQDNSLSSSERKDLISHMTVVGLNFQEILWLNSEIKNLALLQIDEGNLESVIEWMSACEKVLLRVSNGSESKKLRSFFSPGSDCLSEILYQIGHAKTSLDICVFTISDDRINQALKVAFAKGVKIRIITDNDKQFDRGSDVIELNQEGIDVRIDQTSAHMHHKFALIDNKTVLTGSYNWTRSAEQRNHENIVVIEDPKTAGAFQNEFNELWKEMTPL